MVFVGIFGASQRGMQRSYSHWISPARCIFQRGYDASEIFWSAVKKLNFSDEVLSCVLFGGVLILDQPRYVRQGRGIGLDFLRAELQLNIVVPSLGAIT